jgi:hypothetical protein
MDRHSEILQQQIDQPFGAVDQGFEAVDQHFERVNQRFEAIHRRLDEISALMFVTIAGIFGLIGYIAWDRRTSSQRLHFGPSKDCGRELQAAANVGSRAAAS